MKKGYKIGVFLTGVFMIMLFGIYAHITTDAYLYDSRLYYHASQRFTASGSFDWNNYDVSYRGYVFPLILHLYTQAGDFFLRGGADWISILIGNAIFTSFIFTICLPDILPDCWIAKNNFITRITALVFVIIFWQDLIFYPLSDLYGFGMALLAVKLTLSLKKNFCIVLQGILIGSLFYMAYNIRTIYLLSFILYLFALFAECCKKRIEKGKLICLYAAMAAGILVVSVPQYKINMNLHNKKSIAVITEDTFEGGLFASQLYWGVLYDRYETYIGPADQYPEVPMYFVDSAGEQLVRKEGILGFHSLGAFISFVFRHPIDYLGIIVRHFVSITCMPWNHVYIYDLHRFRIFYLVLNYIILCLFGLYAYQYINENRQKAIMNRKMVYLSVVLVPCFAILFGAVEMRFFMPIYTFIYTIICMGDLKKTLKLIARNWFKTILIAVLFFCALIGFWGAIMGSARELPQLLM